MLASALALTVYNMNESNRAAFAADKALEQLHEIQAARINASQSVTDKNILSDDPAEEPEAATEMATVLIDGYEYIGTITFPSLEIDLPVIAEWDYTRMKSAPCRYSGSYLQNDLVICGHNYSSHFRHLENSQQNDEVLFTDVNGNTYRYLVTEIEVLAPTAIEQMTTGDWDLTVFTCNFSGRARVAVRCKAA